jgi:ADP-heptose:LPS heptosyltransferase
MKILVVRYAAIGDCIMSAWATTALRNAFPDAEIHWAIQPRCSEVVDEDQLAVRKVVPRDKRAGQNSNQAVLRYWLGLRKEKYDLGIDFQGHSKTALALFMARPRKRAGLRATDAMARLVNPVHEAPTGMPHIIEKETWLVKNMTGAERPELPLMPRLNDEREKWRAEGPYISIQTGAGSEDKVVPPHYWQAVAGYLSAAGIKVIAIGGKGDPSLDGVRSLVGELTLSEAMACVAESRVHLAGDTGTGHVAAAYGVPVVSVFGPTNPAICRPWGPRVTVLRNGDSTSLASPESITESALDFWKGWK